MNILDQDPAVGVSVGGTRSTGKSQNPWKHKDGGFSDLRTQLKAQNEDNQSTSRSRLFHSLEKAEEISMESPTPQKYFRISYNQPLHQVCAHQKDKTRKI